MRRQPWRLPSETWQLTGETGDVRANDGTLEIKQRGRWGGVGWGCAVVLASITITAILTLTCLVLPM